MASGCSKQGSPAQGALHAFPFAEHMDLGDAVLRVPHVLDILRDESLAGKLVSVNIIVVSSPIVLGYRPRQSCGYLLGCRMLGAVCYHHGGRNLVLHVKPSPHFFHSF